SQVITNTERCDSKMAKLMANDSSIHKHKHKQEQKQKQKHKNKNSREATASQGDSRHHEIALHIQNLYSKTTNISPPPWGKGEAGALALLLKANPSWTAEHIKRLVDNRFASEVNPAQQPRFWIAKLPDYAQPLDRYNRPRNGNGHADSNFDEKD